MTNYTSTTHTYNPKGCSPTNKDDYICVQLSHYLEATIYTRLNKRLVSRLVVVYIYIYMYKWGKLGSQTATNAFRRWMNDFSLFFAFAIFFHTLLPFLMESSLQLNQYKLEKREKKKAPWIDVTSVTGQTVTTTTWKREIKSCLTRCDSHSGTRQQASQTALNPVCSTVQCLVGALVFQNQKKIYRCVDEHHRNCQVRYRIKVLPLRRGW